MDCCVRNSFPYQNKTFDEKDRLEQQLLDVIMHKCTVSNNFEFKGYWGLQMVIDVCNELNGSNLFKYNASYQEIPSVIVEGQEVEPVSWVIKISNN